MSAARHAGVARALLFGAALAAVALAGGIGGPEALLVWAALAAAPLGALSAAISLAAYQVADGVESAAGARVDVRRSGVPFNSIFDLVPPPGTRSKMELKALPAIGVPGAHGTSQMRFNSIRDLVPPALAPLVLALAFVPGKLLGALDGGAYARVAPTLPWAGAVLVGYACAGAGLARLAGGRGPAKGVSSAGRVALVLLVLGALLHGLPTRGGLGRAPWAPAIAARALDASPVTLVAEAAGIDWSRRPAIYGPAGADSLGPTLRAPWQPTLAGAGALMLGCVLWCAATYATRRTQNPSWRRASSSAPSPRS